MNIRATIEVALAGKKKFGRAGLLNSKPSEFNYCFAL